MSSIPDRRVETKTESLPRENTTAPNIPAEPSLEPYVGRLERFDLFSTNQCYYLIGSNELNTAYRIIKIDRTLIERAPDTSQASTRDGNQAPTGQANTTGVGQRPPDQSDGERGNVRSPMNENHHTAKPTLRPLSEFLTEDPNVYTREEFNDLFDMIQDGNRVTQAGGTPGMVSQGRGGGGLKSIVKAYGIVGFVRFLDCYYLTLITKRARVGSIGGNGMYTIKNTETIPLKPSERSPSDSEDLDPSSVLLSMWNRGKRSVGLGLTNREINEIRYQGLYQVVDLSKSFFFSYTYDLTRSLQENFLATTTKTFPPPPAKQDNFSWNHFLTREFEGCLHSLTSYQWIIPIIHGAIVQRKVNDYGRSLNLVLIARRSRFFAGTRYLKRGINEQGKVANEVEHEQIVHDESKLTSSGTYASYLQIRGSIPTFWAQEGSVTMPKPPIELNRVDPTYAATQMHFEDLFKRYSSPILALDLVKQSEKREREVRVGNEYRHAINYINNTIGDAGHKIRYCALDFSHINKHRNLDVNASLNEVSAWAVAQTGFFCSSPRWKVVSEGVIEPFIEQDGRGADILATELGVPVFPMEQGGVLRTNCIDCLDRTNDTQLRVGVEALSQQLVVMGIRSREKLDPSSNLVRVLSDMYSDIGDSVALQYGGSEAHKKVTVDRSESNMALGKHKELFTSIKRYYSNAFTDRLKQDAMNLFLGYYLPFCHSTPLWELETDYHLHNFHTKAGRGVDYSMKTYRTAFGLDESRNAKSGFKISDKGLLNESLRAAKVRGACMDQHGALSSWWRQALQSHIQQRMWMKLGPSQPDLLLPTRYERLYQPHRIASFDRFFMRSWATPVRGNHGHIPARSNHSELNLKRAVSPAVRQIWNAEENCAETGKEMSLEAFVDENGFEPRHEPLLKRFVAHHDRRLVSDRSDKYPFLSSGSPSVIESEYKNYVTPLSETYASPLTQSSEALSEFTDYLHEFTLSSDDVTGIQKLADSAFLGKTLQTGPYRGLSSGESALEVATAVHEQFNALESFTSSAYSSIEEEMNRRGLYSDGVKETVANDWSSLNQAEKQYEEVMSLETVHCRRSDLTTPSAMRLYSSMVNGDSELSTAEVIFVCGEYGEYALQDQGASEPTFKQTESAFVKKANRLGIRVAEYKKPSSPSLFGISRLETVPPGFEQINDDMYCWKRNKFVVFNGVGATTWNQARTLTKLTSAQHLLYALTCDDEHP